MTLEDQDFVRMNVRRFELGSRHPSRFFSEANRLGMASIIHDFIGQLKTLSLQQDRSSIQTVTEAVCPVRATASMQRPTVSDSQNTALMPWQTFMLISNTTGVGHSFALRLLPRSFAATQGNFECSSLPSPFGSTLAFCCDDYCVVPTPPKAQDTQFDAILPRRRLAAVPAIVRRPFQGQPRSWLISSKSQPVQQGYVSAADVSRRGNDSQPRRPIRLRESGGNAGCKRHCSRCWDV